MNSSKPVTAGQFLTPIEAAKILRVSVRTLYRHVEEGRMPHRRFGTRSIRFTMDDIMGSCKRKASIAEILA